MKKYGLFFAMSFLLLTGCQTSSKASKNKLKAEYHIELADNLLRAGKNPAAIQELQHAINLDPTNSQAHHKMAISLYQRNRIQQAIYHFNQSLLYNPQNTEVRLDLALMYYESKKYKEASKQAQLAVDDLTFPDPSRSYYLLSLSMLELSKKNQKLLPYVKTALISTLNYSPKHCGALYNLGQVYRKEKKNKQAYVLYKRSLKNCELATDKELALNRLIPLSRELGLVSQWRSFNQLKKKLAKKP